MKALAKTLMVLSEDRFRNATAVGASPLASDWQISSDEQVRSSTTTLNVRPLVLTKEHTYTGHYGWLQQGAKCPARVVAFPSTRLAANMSLGWVANPFKHDHMKHKQADC